MLKKIKYISFFAFFWLQLNVFFTELESLLEPTIWTQSQFILQIIYFILFGIYLVYAVQPKSAVARLAWGEKIINHIGLLIMLIVGYSYMSSEWIWNGSVDFNIIFIELFKSVSLGFFALMNYGLQFDKSLMFKEEEQKQDLWNTYETKDMLFFGVWSALLVVNVFASSKLLVGIGRNYFLFLYALIAIFIILYALLKLQLFTYQRHLCYTIIAGLGLAYLSIMLEFLVYAPLIVEQMLTLNSSIFNLMLTNYTNILLVLVMFGWLMWCMRCEKKYHHQK